MSADKIPSIICCISSGHRRGSLCRIEEHTHSFSSSPIAFGPLPMHTTQLWCFLRGFKLGWEVLGESPNLRGVCFVPFTLLRAQFTLRPSPLVSATISDTWRLFSIWRELFKMIYPWYFKVFLFISLLSQFTVAAEEDRLRSEHFSWEFLSHTSRLTSLFKV